ncbi:hypothetical protein DSO57_1013489 [Entomophthora muscae]|uniref:Uncharacterized protein n=1 Tax=Entomophthora muscae TaxID=34485 RepID=A0ACC2SVB9_9FUNG|nr:hypothetical protein DSO57_1013489 [Entomophthora muscae]
MEVQDLVSYSNHQQKYQAALVHCLDLSPTEIQNYSHQNQVHHTQTSQCLNAISEQLNTQLPSIVGKILDLRAAFQNWCQDVTCHILAVEHYVEDATRREATHQEETGCCTSELADVHYKLEALIKEFNDSSQINQSELNRLKDLVHAAEAKIIDLKDNFVKYNNNLQLALEEKLATFRKETEDALILASQTPAAQGTTTAVPEMDEI